MPLFGEPGTYKCVLRNDGRGAEWADTLRSIFGCRGWRAGCAGNHPMPACESQVVSPNPGHSLATLTALDVRRGCPGLGRLDLSCYTFGAPRTGDHAFACDYNRAVPDSWAIINDQAGWDP